MPVIGGGEPPPSSLQSECDVLGHVMTTPALFGSVPELLELRRSDFYSEAHGLVWQTIRELHDQGAEPTFAAVIQRLRERGRLAAFGIVEELPAGAKCPGLPKPIREAVERIRTTAKDRAMLFEARRLEAQLLTGASNDASETIAKLVAMAGEAKPANDDSPSYVIESAADIASPLPPLTWICQGLHLARGSVTIVGGYGYSRKTLYCQDLALSVATGRPALGVYSVERAPVVHIDYEQGQRITRERYQRLARASDIDLPAADLSVITFPQFRLSDGDAADRIVEILDATGAKLVVLDSLRAAVSGIDENSSDIRECIDVLGAACKRADAAAVIIHHARKPSEGKAEGRYSLRGSAAIYDACDGVFVFSGEKGQPTTVDHAKDRLVGTELASFGLATEDVAQGDDLRWGLRLVHIEAEQLAEIADAAQERSTEVAEDRAMEAIRRYLTRMGTYQGSKNALFAEVGGNRAKFLSAMSRMAGAGEISIDGRTITLRTSR